MGHACPWAGDSRPHWRHVITQCQQIISADSPVTIPREWTSSRYGSRQSTVAFNIAGASGVAWDEFEEDLGRRGMPSSFAKPARSGAARPRWPETSSASGCSAWPASGRPSGMSAAAMPPRAEPADRRQDRTGNRSPLSLRGHHASRRQPDVRPGTPVAVSRL